MSKSNKFWKGLSQYGKDNTASKQTEFIAGATDDFQIENMPEVSRRKFMAILGATTAVTAVGCSDYRDKGEIISYNKQPEEITYGKANYYASTSPDGYGILVKTREGRPIKIDGNPEAKSTMGRIGIRDHASILDLYDPGRLTKPKKREGGALKSIEWAEADEVIVAELSRASQAGKEIAVLMHSCHSPSQAKVLRDFTAKYPTTKIYSYELFDNTERLAAWKACYGTDRMPVIEWDKPDVIVSLNSDFLASEGDVPLQSAKFASRRDVDSPKKFNKLYAIEGEMSATGSLADYRIRLSPEAQGEFALALLKLATSGAVEMTESISKKLAGIDIDKFIATHHIDKEKLNELISDIRKNPNGVYVHAGDALPQEVHATVNLLNLALNDNAFLSIDKFQSIEIPLSTKEEMDDLVNDMQSQKIHLMLVAGTNPLYHFPKDFGFDENFDKIPIKVSLNTWENETSQRCDYVLPTNHYLESWGDHKTETGSITTRQPVISPLYDTREFEAALLNWASGGSIYEYDIYHKFIKQTWEESFPTVLGFNDFWFSVLHDGYYEFDEPQEPLPAFSYEGSADLIGKKVAKSGFTVLLTQNPNIGDGRGANNGWLQEIPHTVTKIVWDNAAAMSPATAKELGVAYGRDKMDKETDFIELEVSGRKMKLPIFVQAGMADKVIAVDLGYGREHGGAVAAGVGHDVMKLASAKDGITKRLYTGAKAKKVEGTYELVSTQEHHDLDDTFVKDKVEKRYILYESTVDEYIENPHVLHFHEPDLNIYPGHEYKDVKWGMAIDLNKCTGCNQCTAACNVENNIQVVGKDQVAVGREMHWMRIDLYYSGHPNDPHASLQPMLCQHCDDAPCENVCPVVATTHSPDGINQMVYNRCVGTRYCANNCPYKVRRFNFFDFDNRFRDGYYEQDSVELMRNPEVTVRSRGVMEKCTFCIQRVMEARQNATAAGEKFDGRSVTTACQDACPTEAIVFGNTNDPDSKISKLRKHNLGYHVLDMTNVKPNVTYIAKLWNKKAKEGHSNEQHH